MKRIIAIWLISICLLGCVSIANEESVNQVVELQTFSSFHFWQSIESAQEKGLQEINNISGGIAPHHLLADAYISHYYQSIKESKNDFSRIILICPNHFHDGNSPIITHNGAIKTPIGVSDFDNMFINELVKSVDFIKCDTNNIIKNEHGITAHVPYIQFAMPDATIVPLVIDATISNLEADQLAEYLIENHTEDTIYICSMDFSHYLLQPETNQMDSESIESIRTFNYNQINQYSDEHLDTPKGLIIFLKVMESLDATNMQVLGHSSASKIMKTNTTENTSYFTIVFDEI